MAETERERVARQLRMLERMTELGVELAAGAARRAMADPGNADAAIEEFNRITEAVLQGIEMAAVLGSRVGSVAKASLPRRVKRATHPVAAGVH